VDVQILHTALNDQKSKTQSQRLYRKQMMKHHMTITCN